MLVNEINWDEWTPTETAVITYIRNKNKVLLIHKKTGLGAGKINAPGGHIEDGESPEAAAVRETREEVNLETWDLSFKGELYFHFLDGLRLKGSVFLTEKFSGEALESDEARPFWCSLDEIPWDRMWEDDIHWLPRVLDGENFTGHFVFDGEKMVDKKIRFY